VTATIRDVDSGDERRVRAKYLVGADGAHSKVRELMGIEFDGRGVFSNAITIYFHAPLAPYVVGKALSVIYVKNAELSGFFRMDKDGNSGFLVVNTVGDTSRP
jgi:flavin-dependent dehydrogenase